MKRTTFWEYLKNDVLGMLIIIALILLMIWVISDYSKGRAETSKNINIEVMQ